MAFEASSSYAASTSQESVVVTAQELMLVLNTLNEKRKAKARKEQPDPRLKQEMPEVIESQSQSHKQMELSQIELTYRAEGNANLVLALPQFKKVLRLPKVQQQQQKQYQETQYNQKHSQQQQGEQQMQRQQQQQREKQQDIEKQQEPNQILITGQQQSKNDVGILTMDHYVAYISIIRCLVGNEFVFEADIVAVPNPNDRHWINEHIKPYRPANRLDKEFGGHFGLLLPDATQLPAEFDALFSNEQVKQKKINQRSKYCPFDLYSGCSSRMFYALESLFACPQNNLRIFKNGRLIFDDQLSQTLSVEDLFSSDKLQLIKHLLVTCLLREYANERHETYAESKQQTTTAKETATVATIARDMDLGMAGAKADAACMDVAGSVAGEPQSSVTSCKKQKFNTMPKTTNTFTSTTTTTTATSAIATTTITETEVTTVKSTMTLAKPIFAASIPHTSPPSHNIPRLEQINKAEVTCLPRNCVLQKILNLQLLAKINLQFMLDHGYGVKKEKTYNIVWKLLEKFKKHHNELTVGQLTPEEQYILAATALDCSIMITFCEIENVPKESLSDHHRSVVHLGGKTYLTKVTLLDLDPKPDTHFSKYCQQTKQIMTALKDLM